MTIAAIPAREKAQPQMRANSLARVANGGTRCLRELWACWTHEKPQFPSVAWTIQSIAALSSLDSNAPREADSDTPIFLLSTGMRTGSTLLQRILITDSRLLLWGEPMAEMGVVPRITQMLSESHGSPFLASWKLQPNIASPDLTKSWIALLHPPIGDLRMALRSLFQTWLAQPARRQAFARWGFKSVRLDAADAVLLHWLYPNAKFILLTRHPYDCYRSFADGGWPTSFTQYPDVAIDSAVSFAREWNRIAMSWSELPSDFSSMLIKYEDLVSGNFDFRNLESWLGLKLNESDALSEKVGRTAFRARLHAYERWIVSHEAAAGMRLLGYNK